MPFETIGLHVTLARTPVLRGVNLRLPAAQVVGLIGPNGCGKTTLLRSLAGLIHPDAGQVLLTGQPLSEMPARNRARRIGLLPQSAEAPEGIRVADLVARGRTPHLRPLHPLSSNDHAAVAQAMASVGIADLALRRVDQLSGGQRQRVWIAMVLAQETEVVLLDEPTSYLDLPHQIDLLRLITRLGAGRSVIMVLHDLALAGRFCDRLVAMRAGCPVAQGSPQQVLTPETLRAVFDLDCAVMSDPLHGAPLVIPH